MFISNREYEELIEAQELKNKLEEEVQRLSELISAEVKDCKVGVWCKDCQHMGKDYSFVKKKEIDDLTGYLMWTKNITGGEVQFCKKHLHDICPEFELRKYFFGK